MTMIMTESKRCLDQEVTRLGGIVLDHHGYRMDVNLWFRHKNEALFYLDSVGKIHGPMDQTYSVRLGPVEKSGKEIAFKREFLEENEKYKWKTCNEIQNANLVQLRDETKHVETMLKDVSSNKMNNFQKSYLTTATHFIPTPSHVEVEKYSTSITKNNARQGVTVNLKAPVETIVESNIRERRLIDELLDARNELNTLRRTKSVIDTSQLNDHSSNYHDEKYVSKVVTDVQPTVEKVRTQHVSSRQESDSKVLPQMSQMSSIQKSKQFIESQSGNGNSLNRHVLDAMRSQQAFDKPSPQPIPVTFSSSSNKSRDNNVENSTVVRRTISSTQDGIKTVLPVENVERSLTSTEQNDQDNHHEEKTVTIKRKITRRKKCSENANHLRDSYIQNIFSPLPTYDSESDTEDTQVNKTEVKPAIIVSEVVPLKQTSTYERPPTIVVPSSSFVKEESIVPIQKGTVSSGVSFDFMKNSDANKNPLFETTSRETFINEKQMAPVSTYSARKENIKSQQLLDERNLGSRTLHAERNMGHRNEMTEEIETITLQPIGKGVQDLAPPPNASLSRPMSRAATPKAFDGNTVRSNYYREESKQIGNYNTMPMKFAKANSVRNVNQTSNYDFDDFYKRGNSAHRVENARTQNSSFNRSSANDRNFNTSISRSNANDQAYNTSGGRTNAYDQNILTNKVGNAQTINTSWHTKTESYSGGNRGYQGQMSPLSNQESVMSNVIVTSSGDDQRCSLQVVLNSEEQWYQPNYSREDVIEALRNKEAGSFYIRNSSTFAGAYGLALKVAFLPDNAVRTNDHQGDLVRHFLIETLEGTSGNGVRLKGFVNELIYPSLAHLVQAHCQNAIALPICLVLPQNAFIKMDHIDGTTAKSQYQYESHQQHQQQMGSSKAQLLSQSHRSMSSPGVNFLTINHPNPLHQNFVTHALYLGKVDIDRMTGDAAIEYAVDKIMKKISLKTSTVEIELDSTKGITLNDKMQKIFYTRQFPAQHVLYAGFDPKRREFQSQILNNNGLNGGKIMGIVVKKQKIILRENVVHLFCEIDDTNNFFNILSFIKDNYLRRV